MFRETRLNRNFWLCAKVLFVSLLCCSTSWATDSLPFLSSGNAVATSGNFTTTNTQFFGGVSVGNEFVTSATTSISGDYSTIKFAMSVDFADVGKQADLLVVLGEDSQLPYDGGSDTSYITLVNEGDSSTFIDLYGSAKAWMAQLVNSPFYVNAVLQNEVSVEFGLKSSTAKMYYIFAGYRLHSSGKIVYSAKPVMLQMANIKVPVEASDHESGLKTTTLSSGMYHSCAIKIDGNVVCWGNNDEDQAPTFRSGHFTQVSMGLYHSCGILANGTVDCWGANTTGQAEPPNGSFIQISAGNSHTCGIRINGTVDCWGEGGEEGFSGYGERIQPPEGTFIQLSAGVFGDTCGIRTDHTMSCWGWQDGNNGNAEYRIDEYKGNFEQVTIGNLHTCVLDVNGTVTCWGNVDSPAGNFSQISSGYQGGCGVQLDGSISCWGNDLLNGFNGNTFTQVSVGGNYACGLHTDSTVECVGVRQSLEGDDYGQVDPPVGLFVAQPKPITPNVSDTGTDEPTLVNKSPIADYRTDLTFL